VKLEDVLRMVEQMGIHTLKDIEDRLKNNTLLDLHAKGMPLAILAMLVDFYTSRLFTTSGTYYGMVTAHNPFSFVRG
jgi:hypothetical protein